jgi:hypothetical protein
VELNQDLNCLLELSIRTKQTSLIWKPINLGIASWRMLVSEQLKNQQKMRRMCCKMTVGNVRRHVILIQSSGKIKVTRCRMPPATQWLLSTRSVIKAHPTRPSQRYRFTIWWVRFSRPTSIQPNPLLRLTIAPRASIWSSHAATQGLEFLQIKLPRKQKLVILTLACKRLSKKLMRLKIVRFLSR